MTKNSKSKAGTAGGANGKRRTPMRPENNDKENLNVYGEKFGLNEKKSPLPEWYPRQPLQDITAVLLPPSSNIDEADSTTETRRPSTRSQGMKRLGNIQTAVVSGKNAKNGGQSSKAVKQVKITLRDVETPLQSGNQSVHLETQAVTFNARLSSSVQPIEKASGGQMILEKNPPTTDDGKVSKEIVVLPEAEHANGPLIVAPSGNARPKTAEEDADGTESMMSTHNDGGVTPTDFCVPAADAGPSMINAAESSAEELPPVKMTDEFEVPEGQAFVALLPEGNGVKSVAENLREVGVHTQREPRAMATRVSDAPSSSLGRSENSHGTKRGRPLTGRSKVSSFR